MAGLSGRDPMRIRHARLDDGDTTERQGVPVTSSLRTAFELTRHLTPVEAVAAVDMVLHRGLARVDLRYEGARVVAGPPPPD